MILTGFLEKEKTNKFLNDIRFDSFWITYTLTNTLPVLKINI